MLSDVRREQLSPVQRRGSVGKDSNRRNVAAFRHERVAWREHRDFESGAHQLVG